MNLRTRIAGRILALGVTLSSVAVASSTEPAAAAPANGCPAGYQVLVVADLAALGYQVPGAVDDPASGVHSYGAPGNGDGLVCGVQLGNQLTPWGTPVFNFMDNSLP